MDSDEHSRLSHVNGFVIITLPPPENPSLGKTITAFTLTDVDDHHQSQNPQQSSQEQHNPPPVIHPPQTPPIQTSFSSLLPGFTRKFVAFVGVSVCALVLFSSVFSRTLQELNNSSEDQNQKKSFIFPLYHKLGIREVPERNFDFKLGRFIDLDTDSVVNPFGDHKFQPQKSQISNKFASNSNVAGDSSPVFPVRGNVFPDGYVYF